MFLRKEKLMGRKTIKDQDPPVLFSSSKLYEARPIQLDVVKVLDIPWRAMVFHEDTPEWVRQGLEEGQILIIECGDESFFGTFQGGTVLQVNAGDYLARYPDGYITGINGAKFAKTFREVN
jgi:hypothetical protein